MKENEKILISKSLLKITFIMICISVTLKSLGLNIFEADRGNKILLFICNIIEKYHLKITLNFILLIIQIFIVFRLSCKSRNLKTYYICTIISAILTILSQYFIFVVLNLNSSQLGTSFYFIISFSILILFSILIDINIKYKTKSKKSLVIRIFLSIWNRVKKPITLLLVISVYQFLVMFLRNITYIEKFDILYNFLLNFDYIILLLVTYYLFLKKETNIELKSAFDFSITKLLNERPSIEDVREIIYKIKEKTKSFSETNKTEKVVIVVYIFFFALSELFNLGIIILVAFLNQSIIECFFIVTSFLISRKIFGALHLNSAIKCWLVSNISFFILNKITLNVEITFVVPILCGIALSYITSKFIKKTNKSLYRGMPREDLLKICKNKDLNKLEINILTDFYCNRESLIKLTYKYNYSRTQIYEHKLKALKKLET